MSDGVPTIRRHKAHAIHEKKEKFLLETIRVSSEREDFRPEIKKKQKNKQTNKTRRKENRNLRGNGKREKSKKQARGKGRKETNAKGTDGHTWEYSPVPIGTIAFGTVNFAIQVPFESVPIGLVCRSQPHVRIFLLG